MQKIIARSKASYFVTKMLSKNRNNHNRLPGNVTQTYIAGVLHLIDSILLLEVFSRKDPVHRRKQKN